MKERTDEILAQSQSMAKTFVKNQRRKFKDKLIEILVQQFENVFTVPDDELLKQDDDPRLDRKMEIEDEDDDEEDSTEEKQLRDDSFMYFIRTGQFEVTIQSKTNTIDISPAGKQVKAKKQQLYNGDHFGEIGLIFNSKRTASVKSLNYGTLAKLTKPGYKVLLSNFASLKL